jgi:hypothetical protein
MKIISIIFIGIIVIAGTVCGYSQRPRMGQREIERWEITNHTFRIRVTAYPEENGWFIAGAYYVFQCTRVTDGNWREIMTVRHDDPVKIPREQVRFVSDQVGYVFMLYNYAVTVDGGATWSVWYAPKDLPGWRAMRADIDDVQILRDGSGRMRLRSATDQPAPELHTTDYGKHWNP